MWQGEYANKLPLIRTLLAFGAYSEGWALYAQQLADEFGAYDDFPAGRLGYLQGIAFRACRLVVDTGLHAKGWSRERGVRFFVDENGTKQIEAASESIAIAAGRAMLAATYRPSEITASATG